MTQEEISQASREELIELVLTSEARREELEQQLRWFKKQLFGTKSERRPRLSDDASQLCLGEICGAPRAANTPRRRRPRSRGSASTTLFP